MDITLINLPDGSVRVHKTGCRDIGRELRKGCAHYTAEVASKHAAYLEYNSDFIEGDDPDETQGWELNFAPCCDALPR